MKADALYLVFYTNKPSSTILNHTQSSGLGEAQSRTRVYVKRAIEPRALERVLRERLPIELFLYIDKKQCSPLATSRLAGPSLAYMVKLLDLGLPHLTLTSSYLWK